MLPDKELIVIIGNITAGADIDTELIGYSYVSQNEKIAISQGSNTISNIAIGIDNETSSTTTYRTVTYYKYDNNGNMIEERINKSTGEELTTYSYNDFNQLIEVINPQGTTTFTYYPSGLRESKTHGTDTTKYYYDGQNVIIETKNNILSARNIYGIESSPVVRQNFDTTGNIINYLYLKNGHGDVATLVDEQCNILKSYEYDIYGEILQANGLEVDNPIGYAGQYYDKETGLYYLRARYYDPGMMRFIVEDSYKGDVKDPMSLNLYTYCVGNPIKYTDPSGHKTEIDNENGGDEIYKITVENDGKVVGIFDIGAEAYWFFVGVKGQVEIAMNEKYIAIVVVGGGGPCQGNAGAGIAVGQTLYNTTDIDKLKGLSFLTGAEVSLTPASGGIDGIIGDGVYGISYSLGITASTPGGNYHAYPVYTVFFYKMELPTYPLIINPV